MNKDFFNSENRLQRSFFARNAEIVARELLGKILVRNINGKELKSRIVETEAYYDESDPASRACKNGDLKETMKMKAGTILIYGVHNCWLMNFVTGCEGRAEAVLLRALEPLNFNEKCNGPGLLTRALKIDKKFHKKEIIDNEELFIIDDKKMSNNNFNIVEAFRIGVKKDLSRKLRFYIKNNKFVSKK